VNRTAPLPLISPFIVIAICLVSTACTTIENRLDLYRPQTVQGPYTRMLHHGIPSPTPLNGTQTSGAESDGKNVITPQQQ